MIEINQPNITNDNQAQALLQMRSYLYQLSGQLNWAFSTLESSGSTNGKDIAIVGQDGSIKDAVSEDRSTAEVFNDLKGLIIKSADIVNAYYDTIKGRLDGVYVAESEFGSYQATVSTTIEETAMSVVRNYDYSDILKPTEDKLAGFESYMNNTQGFIRQGFIDRDKNGVPILGIAIGQDLESEIVQDGDRELVKFKSDQSCAFYTANKVSFRIGGDEVAYISDQKLYIKEAEVLGKLVMNGWQISDDSVGLTFRYIGG